MRRRRHALFEKVLGVSRFDSVGRNGQKKRATLAHLTALHSTSARDFARRQTASFTNDDVRDRI